MAIDINKLPEILKTGKIEGEGTRAILHTPLCRASFVNLVEEETFQGNPTGRHSATLLFETAEGQPGAIDPSLLLQFFQSTLTAYQLTPRNEGGDCVVGKQIMFHKGEKYSQEGKLYQGHGPGTISLKANSKITATNPEVTCYNARGEIIKADAIYSGCWVRAVIGIYKPKSYPNLSITLKSIQFVTDGDRFASDGLVMDGIDGAEDPPATGGDLSQFM